MLEQALALRDVRAGRVDILRAYVWIYRWLRPTPSNEDMLSQPGIGKKWLPRSLLVKTLFLHAFHPVPKRSSQLAPGFTTIEHTRLLYLDSTPLQPPRTWHSRVPPNHSCRFSPFQHASRRIMYPSSPFLQRPTRAHPIFAHARGSAGYSESDILNSYISPAELCRSSDVLSTCALRWQVCQRMNVWRRTILCPATSSSLYATKPGECRFLWDGNISPPRGTGALYDQSVFLSTERLR